MFFIPKNFLDRMLCASDRGYEVAVAALKEAHQIALQALSTENIVLRKIVHDQHEELNLEKARNQALVDRLLVRDAKVFPVQPIAQEAVKAMEADRVRITKVLDDVFAQTNTVGEDIPEKPQGAAEVNFGGGGRILSS